ncbi:MAG: hypothetical protein JNK76_23360 [Planctomycetales bacterium]|nr:hypothetical protein [Planctomycetales bacterium]
MKTKATPPKSCDSQPLNDQMPSRDWDLERLSAYARYQHGEIERHEGTLSAYYWRLGNALTLARKNFAHGQWESYLRELKIDKTRSSKACAIFRSFASAADVADMSVEDAYAARRAEKEPKTDDQRVAELPVKFAGALGRVEKAAERTLAVVDDWSAGEKQEMLKRIEHAIKRLEEHALRLRQELQVGSGD